MGEYASYKGQQIKIGTCEDLYYLRADQIDQLDNPSVVRDHLDAYRFRFPFPDEDDQAPGAVGTGTFERRLRVDGASELLKLLSPDSHYSIQLRADHGYLLSIPCPEGTSDHGTISTAAGTEHPYKVHRNGFRGALFLTQQRYWEGQLVGVVECACGAAFRLETLEMAERVAVALRSDADRHHDGPGGLGNAWQATFLNTVADRLLAGYAATVSA